MSLSARLMQQAAARRLIDDKVREAAAGLWDGMASLDPDEVDRVVARLRPLVEAGQLQTSAITSTYLSGVLSEMSGEGVRVATLSRAGATNLRPVPFEEVYRRPVVQAYAALKGGQTYEAARRAGRDRLLRLVEDDLSLTSRHATREGLRSAGIRRFRRVIRPELARTGTCGLCIAASDQTYSSDNLMPVHTRCNCAVLPIIGENDPGREINGQDISSLYRDARLSTDKGSRGELAKFRVSVHEHGELGPVLARAGDSFTGPGDLAAAA